jgi:hypothetical protein
LSTPKALPLVLVACAAATLFHHAHNAEFFAEYPNMPAWLSRASVYVAWLCAALVGIAGYVLLRRGYRRAGLPLLVLYACYSLDGLAHYALAPMSAYTAVMNLSIWLEAAAGAGLLLAIAKTT